MSGRGGLPPLETFLRGMETLAPMDESFFQAVLETFLRGMETAGFPDGAGF